jgi:hypothetical protein
MKICDLCRKREGVRFVDNFWACAECVEDYLLKIELEANNTRYVLHLEGLVSGEAHEYVYGYVVSYDPDVHRLDGGYDRGELILTHDRQRARMFASWREAFNCWRSSPRCLCHARQQDGEVNRPLAKFHPEIKPVALCPK